MNKSLKLCLGLLSAIGLTGYGPLHGQALVDKKATHETQGILWVIRYADALASSSIDKLVDYCLNTPEDNFRSAASVASRNELINNNFKVLKKLKLR